MHPQQTKISNLVCIVKLSWQVAGYGPMMGQATHFNRYATEDVPYGTWRYTSESRRLNHVLNQQLVSPPFPAPVSRSLHDPTLTPRKSNSPFIAGDRLTVADIAIFIFAHSTKWCGIDINEYPHVKAWHDKLLERPAFQNGLQVPVPYQFKDAAVSDPDAQEFYRMQRKFGGQMIKGATDRWAGEVVPLPSDHSNY